MRGNIAIFFKFNLLLVCGILASCGGPTDFLAGKQTQTRYQPSINSSDSQDLALPTIITANNDGGVNLPNRYQSHWDGLEFVGSQNLGIIPIE